MRANTITSHRWANDGKTVRKTRDIAADDRRIIPLKAAIADSKSYTVSPPHPPGNEAALLGHDRPGRQRRQPVIDGQGHHLRTCLSMPTGVWP